MAHCEPCFERKDKIQYVKAVLERRDHAWLDVLSHLDGVGAHEFFLAKLNSWYCDRMVIPANCMVLDPSI